MNIYNLYISSVYFLELTWIDFKKKFKIDISSLKFYRGTWAPVEATEGGPVKENVRITERDQSSEEQTPCWGHPSSSSPPTPSKSLLLLNHNQSVK